MKPVEFDSEAQAEFLDAVGWYAERSTDTARRFIVAVDAATADIQRWPLRFPVLEQPATHPPVRRARLRQFPYALIFIGLPDQLRVLAVAHLHRRPLYWVSRLPKT